MDNQELRHHGVKGMKWGVRRYRTSVGSYTQTGVKVFDKKMQEYESADKKVKELKERGDKMGYRSAVRERKIAKNKLNASYKQIKRDHRADKGKSLYESGKTITGNMSINMLAQAGIIAGSKIAAHIVSKRLGNYKMAQLTGMAIGVGGTAVNAILAAKTYTENRNLRAYYGHSRRVK